MDVDIFGNSIFSRWWSTSPSSSTSSSSMSSSSSPLAREDTVEVSYVAYTQPSKCPRGSSESNISSLLYSGTRGGTVAGRVRTEGIFARLPKIRLVSSGSDVVYEMNARNSEILVYAPKNSVLPGRRFRVLVKLRPNSHLNKFSIRFDCGPWLNMID